MIRTSAKSIAPSNSRFSLRSWTATGRRSTIEFVTGPAVALAGRGEDDSGDPEPSDGTRGLGASPDGIAWTDRFPP